MKTLKTILAGITLLLVCVATSASANSHADKLTKNDVVKIYIDAVAHGDVKSLANVLDEGLTYEMKRGDNINTLNKDQLLESLKNSSAPSTNITTKTTVVSDDDDASIVKVEFNFGDFVRTDMITLGKSNGWLITKVVTSYK